MIGGIDIAIPTGISASWAKISVRAIWQKMVVALSGMIRPDSAGAALGHRSTERIA